MNLLRKFICDECDNKPFIANIDEMLDNLCPICGNFLRMINILEE